MIKLNYFKQKRDYTCGPVSLQMILNYFGKKVSRNKLIEICSTTRQKGTSHRNLIKAAKSLGFFTYSYRNSDFINLKYYIDRGLPIIINYIEPSWNYPHYSVVTGFDENNVLLNDPWNGENFKISKREFIKRWYNYHNSKKWMLIISKEKLS